MEKFTSDFWGGNPPKMGRLDEIICDKSARAGVIQTNWEDCDNGTLKAGNYHG